MASAGKVLLRVVFVLFLVLVIVGDYTGLLGRLLGSSKTEADAAVPPKTPPRPTNPGYGDTKTEIDIDADIEDDSIQHFGK